jgi:hypothetical protein
LSKELENINIKALVSSEELHDVHFSAVHTPPIIPRGQPPIDKMRATYKIQHASCQDEALEWMNKNEKIALLTDKDVFNSLTKLAS